MDFEATSLTKEAGGNNPKTAYSNARIVTNILSFSSGSYVKLIIRKFLQIKREK